MQSRRIPHLEEKRPRKEEESEFIERPHGEVWQDRSASMRARITSSQASHATAPARAHPLNINSDRRKKHSTTRKTDQAIGWVKRPISSLINEKARLWKVSRSQAIARLIEMGMANDLFQAHEQ